MEFGAETGQVRGEPLNFHSLYAQGFARVAACTNVLALGDPQTNAERILEAAAACSGEGAAVALFPECSLSGYAIDDLFLQDAVLDAVEAAVVDMVDRSADLLPVMVFGAPIRFEGRVYNCAVLVHRGRLLGIVPKVYLPNYREFYDKRWFASGAGTEGGTVEIGGLSAPFGPDLLFAASDVRGLVIHAEICEDMWVPMPPSTAAALAGATVLLNLSASNIVIGKSETRRMLCRSQSARCLAAYVYAAAGVGESTTDLAWDGQVSVFENGVVLAESERFPAGPQRVVADIDLDLLRQERAAAGVVRR